ncbi:hypothetical protein GALMADRAFT_142796 [Galerina marginata CBS 339.88]|uniref:Uncharacterized protein n=1 Tax=Galerina marginata (strain CBS 339.88) TaxID=685588 RepID=A0A067SNI2_GALM3|nr:hypothetical protein GALMADRAFT_142796 [Galerina marginata CBS 339.88]
MEQHNRETGFDDEHRLEENWPFAGHTMSNTWSEQQHGSGNSWPDYTGPASQSIPTGWDGTGSSRNQNLQGPRSSENTNVWDGDVGRVANMFPGLSQPAGSCQNVMSAPQPMHWNRNRKTPSMTSSSPLSLSSLSQFEDNNSNYERTSSFPIRSDRSRARTDGGFNLVREESQVRRTLSQRSDPQPQREAQGTMWPDNWLPPIQGLPSLPPLHGPGSTMPAPHMLPSQGLPSLPPFSTMQAPGPIMLSQLLSRSMPPPQMLPPQMLPRQMLPPLMLPPTMPPPIMSPFPVLETVPEPSRPAATAAQNAVATAVVCFCRWAFIHAKYFPPRSDTPDAKQTEWRWVIVQAPSLPFTILVYSV